MSVRTTGLAVFAALLLQASGAAAQSPKPPKPADNYNELFDRYLEASRRMPGAVPPERQAWAWMDGLSFDRKARNVNDLVTIRVIESIAGSGSANSALAKESEADAGWPKLFGLENLLPSSIDPANLVSGSSNTDFKGSGSTTRAGEFTAQITARVSDVLPNGDLVVEGVRELDINGDRQIVVLTGVIRTADIGPRNTVLSSSIGQLSIRYFGRGLIKDNLQPGWLIRILNMVF